MDNKLRKESLKALKKAHSIISRILCDYSLEADKKLGKDVDFINKTISKLSGVKKGRSAN